MLDFGSLRASCAIFYPYKPLPDRCILIRMNEFKHGNSSESNVEYVKGCPVCEHTDPQLELELQEFAQWLFEVMIADQKAKRDAQRKPDVDKNS
jgi:hypothetical protein